MNRLRTLLLLILILVMSGVGRAQEQYQGLCAQIKIVISQDLTLERVGFLATLQITDNDSTDPIMDFAANLTFENPLLSSNGVVNDSSSMFFVQPPTLQNVTAVDGTGVIAPGATATVSWFIIPTVNAGGMTPQGILYNIGAMLGGSIHGVPIPATTLEVIPAPITVMPDAQLQITYFTPRDTIGIDPFTGQGSPIPFDFAVLVQNVGYGIAKNVIIQSQQPKIVQNSGNLLIVAQLLGSSVNDAAMSNADLTVNVGNLNPGQTAKGVWHMITTLSGTFVSVSATYQHSTALGGQETSLIQSVNSYLYLHEVLDDQPGRDNIRDFLADTSGTLDSIANLIPDSLYESQGYVFPVNFLTNATVVGSSSPFQVDLSANFSGWGYLRVNDPGQAQFPIASVVRSDGKVLNANNFWTSIHYNPITNFKYTYLNIFDLVNLGNYTYNVTYAAPVVSTNAPETTMLFDGPSTFTNGVYYITPQTEMYFVSQDSVPVTIYDSVTNQPFSIAFPFTLSTPGSYAVSFYGKDTDGNQETTHNVILDVLGPGSLGFAGASVPVQPIFNPGSAVSIRPGVVPINFQASPDPTAVNARIDVFQGVVGWVTVSNVPCSPTANSFASLNVGGQNVDYYTWQLNNGAWSVEQPVSAPITLSGLPAGNNVVSILGRSQYGSYLNVTNALIAGWVVNPSAPATTITGTPTTPSLGNSADLTIGGAGVTSYDWTLNNSYYRAPTSVSTPLVFSNLVAGQQVVDVLGTVGGVLQPTNNPTSVAWTINPLYGYDMSSLTNVFSVNFTNIGANAVSYNWNGESSKGVIEPAGWYTIRTTLSDSLGNTNFFFGLAQIGTLSGNTNILANFSRNPVSPYARGRWTVWQDQSDGNWEIYARDVTASTNPIIQITHTNLAQENPRTDGRYIVWQGQQANGSWDVFIDDLNGTAGPLALTSTPTTDEVNPAVDWPWVVYQSRATGSSAPWQLIATNSYSGQSFPVSPSTQDELDPDVQAARVVWQDLRNPGAGEIYLCDLQSTQVTRLTDNLYGKYHPAIYNNWIVWSDARNIELDIYGYDLLRNQEVRITSAPEDESQPYLNGQWLLCMEDSLGPQTGNGHLVQLPSLLSIPLTRTPTLKTFPALADGWAVWQETISNQSQIVSAMLPSLQAVYPDNNVVAITPAMVSYAQNAFGLLSLWASNGVQSVTEYTTLVPQVATETAFWTNGMAGGQNFSLVTGGFLWIQFNANQVIDLGVNNGSTLNLAAGASVFSYTGFPDAYDAFNLLRQLGLNNVLSVRMLDSASGRWRIALVQNGNSVGDNFPIPNTAVLMVNMANAVTQFYPQSP
jgi:beta propeller repeat protein